MTISQFSLGSPFVANVATATKKLAKPKFSPNSVSASSFSPSLTNIFPASQPLPASSLPLLKLSSNHSFFLSPSSSIGTGLLAGIYYFLYFFSKEKAVGGGDWILCISIAIFLGRWELVIIELFLSNLSASFAAIPQTLKKDKKTIPIGPFLIISMLIILLASDYLLKFLVIY